MGLFNKLKNVLFEEEEIEIPVEEEKPKIKPKKVEAEKKPLERKRNIYESEVADDTPIVSDSSLFKAEKTFDFPVFDDQEFESMKVSTKKEEKEEPKNMGINLIDYDRPKIKKEKKERTPEIRGRAYDAKTTAEIATRKFQPSPVISPVYGVLDKNYKKEDIVVVKEDKIYLKEYYDAEIFIARRLRLLAHEKKETLKKYDNALKEIEIKNNITYNKEQETAIREALTNKCLVITGGPGTGKTTIIKGVIDLYQTINGYKTKDLIENLVLLAPTGRASKRMSEVTNLPASTIHRFLKWNKDTNKFQVNEYNKSKANFVIIDESSMLDTLLLSNLLKGLSTNTKIVFVGDADQLPSVGAGNVLHDLISSEELEVIKLKNLYRQGKDSNIITFAHNINEGILDKDIFNKGEDLKFIKCPDNKVIDTIKKEVSKIESNDYQVLAPMYKTINGIDNINSALQDVLNPKKSTRKEISISNVVYRENDKVIELTNMPDENVFNGDIGTISRIKLSPKKEVYIDYDDSIVKYTPNIFNNFSHGYAISIHKSQGSEFKTIIMPIVKGFHKMLYRKLIYTGVTRSKEKLVLIGDIKALEYAINNTNEQKRRTSLDYYLKNGII